MPREWTQAERDDQAERARRLHREGKLSGGVKRPGPKAKDKVLDTAEKILIEQANDESLSPAERYRAASALVRLGKVKGNGKRESPVRTSVEGLFAILPLPTREQYDELPEEKRTDWLLDQLSIALTADPETFRPIIAKYLTAPEQDETEVVAYFEQRALALAWKTHPWVYATGADIESVREAALVRPNANEGRTFAPLGALVGRA